jgi:hypothetical protein
MDAQIKCLVSSSIYTATDKPDEVKKWQAERANYPVLAQPPHEQK